MLLFRITTVFIFSLLVLPSTGQTLTEKGKSTDYQKHPQTLKDTNAQGKKGEIRIIGAEQISELNVLRSEYPPSLKGYRVQIFFGDRQEAIDKKSEFTEKYPDTPTYISFLAPNFRLRAGDFRTKIEAEKLKKEIESDYRSAYIVRDDIELPPLRGENEVQPQREPSKGKKKNEKDTK
jgi:hypothetical protein